MNVEPHEPGPYRPLSDFLILAAVERACRQHPKALEPFIADHLGFARGPATARRLRPRLRALREDGSLQAEQRASGSPPWELTRRGAARLVAARRAGRLEELPEPPRRRAWRHGRERAERHFEEICAAATDAVEEARVALSPRGGVREGVDAARLLGLSERLAWQFWRLSAAVYCLNEWPEPDEDCDQAEPSAPRPFSCRDFDFLSSNEPGCGGLHLTQLPPQHRKAKPK